MKDKLAIIVPYRDREEHLNVFIPHMHEFLKDKGIDYTIFIAEQSDDRPFNYGKLCNVVTKEIGKEYTYFAFHDIDMLPINDDCDYNWPEVPTHLATNVEAHGNNLPYPQYFGGVVLINREDFEKANGYSNEYWGYGFQDLDLLYRLERSEAYLEKFYDLNKTYSYYNEDDILPYRIEEVSVINTNTSHYLNCIKLQKNNILKNDISPLVKKALSDSFSFSIWFNDSYDFSERKNIVSFEGLDTGIFISEDKYLIGQIWNESQSFSEVSLKYKKNIWNHVVFSFNNKTKEISLTLNNKFVSVKKVDEDFKIHPHYKYIYLSDLNSDMNIANFSFYSDFLDKDVISELYNYGYKKNDLISNKFGITPMMLFDFKFKYGKSLVLDKGKGVNHLRYQMDYTEYEEKVNSCSEIYLPYRLDGHYKSLVHDKDTNIIKRYYSYDPDIEENADIFFNEVIPNTLDYKKIGLNSLKYTILDKKQNKEYELIRIVT